MEIQLSPNASSLFNFHFDDSDLGKTCEISFRITNNDRIPYNLTGTGVVTFAALDNWANPNTTYNNMPYVIETINNALLYPGMNQSFGQFACPGSTSRTGILLTEAPMADTCSDCLQGDGMGIFLKKC
jgi:hypothetical protein